MTSLAWLQPPHHEDPEGQLRARVLHWVLVGSIAVLGVMLVTLPLYGTDPYTLPVFGGSLVACVWSFVLLHRGHERVAAVFVLGAGWLIVLVVAATSGGIRSAQMSTLVVVVMLAGFLLGSRAAIATAAVTSLSALAMIMLGERGLLPETGPRPSGITEWGAITSVLVLAAIFLHQALRAIDDSRAEADEKSRQLVAEMERRSAAEESLQRGQKLEALGRLTGGIAHDFNNILTVLMAQSMFVAEDAESGKPFDEAARRQVTDLQASVERAAMLTRRLLGFAAPGAARPQPVDVTGELTRLTPVLRRVLPETILLRVAASEEGLVVQIDPSQLEQILLNLVLNARDALPEGGELAISASRFTHEESWAARHPGATVGDHIRVTVADDGAGIDPSDRQHIFDPFYTTKALGHGTGLGLSTVHGIVTQAGGQIEVKSEPGEGTALTFFLPASAADALVPETGAEAGGAASEAVRGTVLVCEDEDPVRRVIESVLRGAGFEVLSAPRPDIALELASAHAIDLLVSDVVMPGMSGVALGARLREARPQLPVLLVTGYAPEDVAPHGASREASDVLEKPFTPEALLERVRALLGGSVAKR